MKNSYSAVSIAVLAVIALVAVFFWQRGKDTAQETAASAPATEAPLENLGDAHSLQAPAHPDDATPKQLKSRKHKGIIGPTRGGRTAHLQPLSDEEIRKNRDAAFKLQQQQAALAREEMLSANDQTRLLALGYLDPGNAGDVRLIELALAGDASAEVREEAALQMSGVARQTAEPALLKALTDPAPEVVVTAIESLSALPGADKSAMIAAIKQAGLSSSSEDVRDAAQTALEAMEP